MKLRHVTALAAIVIFFIGCGSQNSPQKTAAADFGCKISPQNAQQMCLMAADQLRLNPDQFRTTPTYSPQATTQMAWGVKTPWGEYASGVICSINTIHYSVVYAQLMSGPQTQRQADYLKSQGLCSDSN